ncbi:MAG TPA: PHB depolymerase family esterase [Albitalea sp.]
MRSAWTRLVAALRRLWGRSEATAALPPVTEADVADAPANFVAPEMAPDAVVVEREAVPALRGRGAFVDGSFSNAAGVRPYKLFVPAALAPGPRALVVMLHGCRQNPSDFATGTRMNEFAEAQGFVVLYPGQLDRANHLRCWNWFSPDNQERGRGEPSLIADLTRYVIETQDIDPRHVFVAGLSAGGAMAAVLAATYPDLYAAVGVHSGLPHAAAHNLATALSAMRHGPATRSQPMARVPVPTIVFHGDADTTVHPDNGEELMAQARWAIEAKADAGNGADMAVEEGQVEGGRAFTRTLHRDAQGRCDAEHWLVHGSGHAWSGGDGKGSFTDPKGPDASAQILRFFLEHPGRG